MKKLAVKDNPYRDQLENLLNIARPRLSSTHDLEFKKCFGAVAGYLDGNIFISCGKFGVALKLPPEILASLFKEDGVKALKYFPRGHVKKDYAVLPKRILNESERLKKLIDKSIKMTASSKTNR
ncbi:MAG: hypothetical protein HOF21_11215 [Nitrospina sp.]|nr:hypothetical protein [Nitrospina sp.]MBT5551871.1 hypothetical protein [Nitrospina sp.]